MSPAGSPNSKFYNAWADSSNKAGGGSIEFVVRDGTSIANFGNVYDRVQKDVLQVGWTLHSILGGQFPLSDVTALPFVVDDNVNCSVALWRYYESGILDAEYKDVVPIAFSCLGSSHLHWAKKPSTIETLNGAKFRATGKVAGGLVQALGGTPIALRGGEIYEALQRGTVDGAVTSWGAFVPYNLWEVTKFHVDAPLGSSPSMYFLARKKWDGLPKAARDALMANGGEKQTRAVGTYLKEQNAAGRAKAIKLGHEIVPLTPELAAKWEKLSKPVIEEWAASHAGGKEALAAYRKIYAEVAAGK
jgi:TRAP-type C4-dicarboxylate transport system substrate-binding protein